MALRKPSIAAWVVNVFAQERAGQLGEALALARELREAQDDLDAAALAKLGRERRLLDEGARSGRGRAGRVAGRARHTVDARGGRAELSAAFFDPVAAAAVASGRLVRALAPSATATDIRDAVAGDLPELEPLSPPAVDELRDRRARRDVERAIATAEKEQASAERELADRDAALRELRARKDELTARVSELEAQLSRARADLTRAERDLPEAEQSRRDAAVRADTAADALDTARKAKDAL